MRTFLITVLLLCCVNIVAYHDPNTGRFISRDPIEEDGGVNLYAIVWNNPVDRMDELGLLSTIPEPEKTPPEGVELPGTGDSTYNCLSEALGQGGKVCLWPVLFEKCTEVSCGDVSLTTSPCDCTQREVILYEYAMRIDVYYPYEIIPENFQRAKELSSWHVIGRTIPGATPSGNPPVKFEQTPWVTRLGTGGNRMINILNPDAHFKFWVDFVKNDWEKQNPNQVLSFLGKFKTCFCCGE